MNQFHRLACAAALVCSASAQAQSSVTVYGIADAGPTYGRYGPSVTSKLVSSNTITASRLGFNAVEDLGGGLKAGFQLEHGYLMDTGAPGSATAFWSRGSYVWLQDAKLGEVRLGRQRMPMWWVFLAADMGGFGVATLSSFNALHGQDAFYRSGTGGFYDNAVIYRTAKINGFSAELGTTSGTSSGQEIATSPREGRAMGANVQYETGNWWAGLGYQNFHRPDAVVNPANPVESQNTFLLAGRFKNDAFTWTAEAIHADRSVIGVANARPSSTGFGTQAKIKIGIHDLDLGVANIRESGSRKATGFHLGYIYYFSKRTQVYAYGGKILNNSNASYTFSGDVRGGASAGPLGYDPSSVVLGMRHAF